MHSETLPSPLKREGRRKTWLRIGLALLLVMPAVAFWFIFEGGLAALQPMTLRAAVPGDIAPEVNMGDWTDPSARPLFVVSGPFTKQTRIESRLYLVQRGTIIELNGWNAYRSPHERGGPRWTQRTIVFGLAERQQPGGKVAWIRARGASGGGGGGEGVLDFESRDWETFPGTLEPGRPCLAYIEGDREITADRTMSVTDFARRNDGNYIVVEVVRSEGAKR